MKQEQVGKLSSDNGKILAKLQIINFEKSGGKLRYF